MARSLWGQMRTLSQPRSRHWARTLAEDRMKPRGNNQEEYTVDKAFQYPALFNIVLEYQ